VKMEYKTISLADRVFDQLEHNILNGTYARGEIISEKRLTAELGVSRTPIREALNRLMAEDLIEESTNGTVVLGMTFDDVSDIYEVKRRVEVLATRRAAEHITDEQLADMKEIIEKQEFYAQKNDTDKVRDLDTEFHDLLYVASKSRVLKRILQPLHHKLMRYRKASLEQTEKRLVESIAEHHQIMDALADHDGDKVETLMQMHIEHAYKGVLQSYEILTKKKEEERKQAAGIVEGEE
jgi:DNA-binding GntR family transcriptional regulator